MNCYNTVSEYLSCICSHVRWKKAHSHISEELEVHIIEHTELLMSKGHGKQDAVEIALQQLGNPHELGVLFDNEYQPKTIQPLAFLTALLFVLGSFLRSTLLGQSTLLSEAYNLSVFSELTTLLCCFLLAAMVIHFMETKMIAKYPQQLYWGLAFGIVVTAVFFEKNSSLYSPYLVLLYPIAFSSILNSFKGKKNPLAICLGFQLIIPAIFIVLNHFYAYLVGSICGAAMLVYWLFSSLPRKQWINCSLIVIAVNLGICLSILCLNRSIAQSYLSILNEPLGSGYIANEFHLVLSNAKIFGQSAHPLPDHLLSYAFSDAILVFMISQYGWVSFFAVILIIVIYLAFILTISGRQLSGISKSLSFGVCFMLFAQTFFYCLTNLWLASAFALPLPFFSFGRISLLMNTLAISMVIFANQQDQLFIERDTWY